MGDQYNADTILKSWLSRNYKPYKHKANSHKSQRSQKFTSPDRLVNLEELERGRLNAAIVVKRYGMDYLPIYKYIENKIEEWEEDRGTLARLNHILSNREVANVKGNFL